MDEWQRLCDVTALRFISRSAKASGWNGSGEGTVSVAQPSANTVTFTESGHWQSDTGRRLKFSNVFRWSPGESRSVIRLEHLRFGPDKPVYLFELDPQDDQTWQSTRPHVCGDDVYSVIMNMSADQIELQWMIKGPNKDEDIRYWYW
ncbi:MAG: hypothetical protein ACI9DC_002902 [Gammaproteobacteria bacterium]|jgi:hypothetical protein